MVRPVDGSLTRGYGSLMTHTPDALVLSLTCTGPNRTCRVAHRAGRSVHVIPGMRDVRTSPALVMPTYHYATVTDGIAAVVEAEATAPTVATDADLYAFRAAGVAHFLPVGWIDPTRRRTGHA